MPTVMRTHLLLSPSCSPNFRRFVEAKLAKLYLQPLRDLFRHPRAASRNQAYFDFTIANTLLSLVSGISALTYPPTMGSGRKFKMLLEQHYPWSSEPPSGTVGAAGAQIIYETFRNPLTHALGIEGSTRLVVFKRRYRPTSNGGIRGDHLREITVIERSLTRPPGWSATLTEKPDKVVLLLDGFYWGVARWSKA